MTYKVTFGFCIGILLTLAILTMANALVITPDLNFPISNSKDKATISNTLTENDINVFKDKVVINIKEPKWAKIAPTNSMLPILNENTYVLQVTPLCPKEVNVGDIVSYKPENSSKIIIHRVVHKDEDGEGPYFVLKGDNNPTNDPGKVRCSQIDRKLVGILY